MTAMNVVEHVTLWYDRVPFRYISKSGIAGPLGRSISNFLKNLQNEFHSGCTSLPSYQQWISVSLSPHPCQHVRLPEVLILAILIAVR